MRPTIEADSSTWPTQATRLSTVQSSATNTDTNGFALSLTSSLGAGHASTANTSLQSSPASRTPKCEENEIECESDSLHTLSHVESNDCRTFRYQDLGDVSIDAMQAEIAQRKPPILQKHEGMDEDHSRLKRAGDEHSAERPHKYRRLQSQRPQARRRSGVTDLREQYNRVDEG